MFFTSALLSQIVLSFWDNRRIFYIAVVNFACKDSSHHVLISFLGAFMIRDIFCRHNICNSFKRLSCQVFLKDESNCVAFFWYNRNFALFDLITERKISFPHFEVLLSDTLIPLMSSNSNDVSLIVTLLTNDVKTCLSKYINGWQVPNNRFICLVLFRSLSIFPAKGFLVRNSFFQRAVVLWELFAPSIGNPR